MTAHEQQAPKLCARCKTAPRAPGRTSYCVPCRRILGREKNQRERETMRAIRERYNREAPRHG